MMRDPAGVWVDIVEQIDPDPAFFDDAARERLAAIAESPSGSPPAGISGGVAYP